MAPLMVPPAMPPKGAATTTTWRDLLRALRRGPSGGVIGAAVLIAGICFYLGVDVWWSVAIGLTVTAVGLALLAARPEHRDMAWPADGPRNRAGTRSDIVELSWSLHTHYGRVGHSAVTRLQRLASQRLATRQLELRDPADRAEIERLLGREPYLLLTGIHRRAPLLRSYLRCLDAVESLHRSEPAGPVAVVAPRERRLTSNLTFRRSTRAR